MSSSSSLALSSHRVLARKYRPSNFQEMVGQETLVKILTNAIQMERLPHAFILTGIRGVGKTTTARIIARALNCIGKSGKETTPSSSPCGECEHCIAIAEDRHIDVLEMDAASRTSVDDVREVIEGTRYKAVSARFKVYIIDEVHMLSKNAFNAFLKTLEEPPSHVKFIFATTELRKVPETILSRCMRLPLQRVDVEVLEAYFSKITEHEKMSIEPGALTLLAQVSDGSVRDGLSLLDQAMILGEGVIKESTVLDMLGLSDRALIFKLFKACIYGIPSDTLTLFHQLYKAGSDPLMILQDLMSFTHWMILRKTQTTSAPYPGLSEEQMVDTASLLSSLSFPVLSRCWQVLTKGLHEITFSPSVKQATEVILLKLCYLSCLPTPDKVIQKLRTEQSPLNSTMASASISDKERETISTLPPQIELPQKASFMPQSFEELLSLCTEKREMILRDYLENSTHLVSYQPGNIALRFLPSVPKDTLKRLKELLVLWTGSSWNVKISEEAGMATVRQQRDEENKKFRAEVLEDPLVQTALKVFPDAELEYSEESL
jgi:DNA polymerase-3 subunit gamma/tau